MSEAVTVLVTGCGAPGFPGTLWSLRNAEHLESIRVVGVDARRRQAGRYLADEFYQVPRADEDAFVDELLSVCRRESVDVVLPQVTRELPRLSAARGAFEAVGATVAVSGPDVVATANDKGDIVERCRALDVPVPETTLVGTDEELVAACETLGYPSTPVVVKPPRSNGSRGMRILDANRDRRRAFYDQKPTGVYETLDSLRSILGSEFPPLLVMEYLPGEEYTVDAYRGAGGGDVVAIPRRRDEVRSGISFRTTLQEHDAIVEHSETLARDLGLEYAFGFQFKLDADGRPKILECNPRIQGTMVAATMGGANLIAAAVGDALDEPLPTLDPVWERTLYRYWGGLGIDDGRVVGNVGDPS